MSVWLRSFEVGRWISYLLDGFGALVIVGVLLVAGIELIFFLGGGGICTSGIGCGLCCVVFYWFLHLVWIMVSVEM